VPGLALSIPNTRSIGGEAIVLRLLYRAESIDVAQRGYYFSMASAANRAMAEFVWPELLTLAYFRL
jgi:hypothetical protein